MYMQKRIGFKSYWKSFVDILRIAYYLREGTASPVTATAAR